MKHKVVACLPVKDEEEFIEKVILSISNFCDKIVILDDHSTDKTEDICRSFNNVIWNVRPIHDSNNKQEGIQKKELMDLTVVHNPDYIICLDGDEIPTPNIVNFLDSIDESVSIWGSRMINLWEDEENYRYDNYITKYGTNVNWDPWNNPWIKYTLLKYNTNMSFNYDSSIIHGGVSKYHPFPDNIDGESKLTDEFHIIHYGKLRTKYKSGELLKSYAKFDEFAGKGSYESRLDWHLEHNRTDNVKMKKINKDWLWKI